ncbi:MAG: CHAT domain-containing tetratricopeptide repeat protein [Coleofasciculus sp. G3-WIS-01]|uniref:CHAT domain-containing protein n=1 Tax=Coleofasciculus sp. G3-WIS-01 TaxID=3069528 RepID=UPI0032F30047
MGFNRIGCTTCVTIFVVVLVPLLLSSTGLFSKTHLLAFSVDARKAEAERWLKQGVEQLRQQELDGAIKSSQQALRIYQDSRDRVGIAQSLNHLALGLYKKGQYQAAEQTWREGIQVLVSASPDNKSHDTQSKRVETQVAIYQLLQKSLIAQGKINQALLVSEQSRAMVFRELLLAGSPDISSVTSPIAPPTIERIQQIAQERNATLVEYSIIDHPLAETNQPEELFIWVVEPTGEITFRQSNLTQLWQEEKTTLTDYVSNIRQSLAASQWGTGSSRRKIRPFMQLYQVLIEPIADKLPTDPNAHVIFIPQQSLLMIPFSPLQDESGNYLLEKHTILTAPAIMVLDITRRSQVNIPESLQQWLVVGNPNPMPGNFSPLPAAEQEAKAIASLVNTQAITGEVATKAEIVPQMSASRVIHLATHGIFDEQQGWESAIALASTQTDNGWLTAKEILDLNLTAELVVLSACNTGRGSISGDGLASLSSALIASGASSVIVSLWSIPDSPTAFLMQEFYYNLQQNSDKAQALRKAMLTTMEKYPDLRDWAAFTLIGESQ